MLFPTLVGASFAPLNLNDLAQAFFARNGATEPNPLLDPATCARMIEAAQAERGAAHSYGGWLEDRSTLWRGSYLDATGEYLHLGVDFTVPAGTPVACEGIGTVVRVDCDVPEEGGWGTRVILRMEAGDVVLIYAHLASAKVVEGQTVGLGTVLGIVGRPPENGGWFSHLHVQAIRQDVFEGYLSAGLASLDGYGPVSERNALAERFPDPLRFVFHERGA